ncbi:MAG: nicotinate (nicotinamide) nucleotide adenylyltransferase [Bacteroidota bacterium]|nr:nicotinate (nicotinamide) nucleotide adenylyltransferase [Bacteroidota bacterium]
MKRTALFFGSFNPIHHGHLNVAQAAIDTGKIKEVIFIVSPQSPFKSDVDLLPEQQRLRMVSSVLSSQKQMTCSDVEFQLSRPNYTINTLRNLNVFPGSNTHTLLMGADVFAQIKSWQNAEEILSHDFMIYPRGGWEIPDESDKITLLDSPMMSISATMIRQKVKQQEEISHLVPEEVAAFLYETHLK